MMYSGKTIKHNLKELEEENKKLEELLIVLRGKLYEKL